MSAAVARCPGRRRGRRAAARGAALFFALMALVALALAAVVLVRSVDTGAQIIGNLGFKQDATAMADRVGEQAIAWIGGRTTGATLYADGAPDSGYYATSLDALDPTGNGSATGRVLVDWNGDGCDYAPDGSYASCIRPSASVAVGDGSGRYVITRLCKAAGQPTAAGNTCAVPVTKVVAEVGGGECKYGNCSRFQPAGGGPYYRVIVRTVGARGTVSLTEALVHF